MARVRFAGLILALSLAGCGGARPPAELAGLWSANAAACEAGVGIRFGADGIRAVYDRQSEVLFDSPRYQLIESGERFKLRVEYDLPRSAGGAGSVGAHGVLVLVRREGGLRLDTHNLADSRTGAVRLRVANDPAVGLMTLEPCDPHPWREGLRGRANVA
jgi:hypothetical protein